MQLVHLALHRFAANVVGIEMLNNYLHHGKNGTAKINPGTPPTPRQ